MAKLEVKEQRPAATNAMEHSGEYIHVADIRPADDWTQHPDD
jgi:hypothetical protein